MDGTLEKPARMQPSQRSHAVVDRLIKSYWAGALYWSDVMRILRNADAALDRLELAVRAEEAGPAAHESETQA